MLIVGFRVRFQVTVGVGFRVAVLHRRKSRCKRRLGLSLTGKSLNKGKGDFLQPLPRLKVKQGTLMFFEYCENATISNTVLNARTTPI